MKGFDKRFTASTFWYWLARQLRPFQRVPLSEHLRPWEVGISRYLESAMQHAASRSESFGFTCGAFDLLGMEFVPRALKAWRPRELFLMLLVQLAFDAVDDQRTRGIAVEEIHRERLIEVLAEYFSYLGEKNTLERSRELVNQFIAEHSLPDPIPAEVANRPLEIDLPLLRELALVDQELKQQFPGEPWQLGLQSLGLILKPELEWGGYEYYSPINCRCFAGTGGDGCHFSLFVDDGRITEKSFVVVTCPDAFDHPNVIVGENLYDFLCLGVRRGYFCLAYILNPKYLDAYTNPDWKPESPADEFPDSSDLIKLQWLAQRLNLKPWTDPNRLAELQEKYLPLLRLPPDAMD